MNITRVLIADDNTDLADALKLLLQIDGYDVKAVQSGQEALDVAPGFLPDVALLDISMPGIDGFKVAQTLRNSPATADTILVAVTGLSDSKAFDRAREVGFDHYFVKGSDIEPLLALLHGAAEPRVMH